MEVKFAAGLLSGLTQSLLFNPWDRALYLSVKEDRAFLRRANFRHPWRGASSSLFHRAASSGMYWPLVEQLLPYARRALGGRARGAARTAAGDSGSSGARETAAMLLAGNGAGALNGVALNWVSATKYRMWGEPERRGGGYGATFWPTIRRMWRNGGLRPFLMGLGPTVARDAIFGGVFMGTRHALRTLLFAPRESALGESVALSLVAGAIATTASAPLNYARNMQFATPSTHPARSTLALLRQLLRDARAEDRPWRFLQRRLRVGWGTARVAVGMASGFELYALYRRLLRGAPA